VVAVLAAASATGCVAYHAKPLSPKSIEEQLAPPAADVLRVRSGALRHPSLPPIAVDVTDGLTPDEAAVLAVLLNPGLRAERDRLALAEAQVVEAKILPNPEFSYGRDAPVSGPPDAVTGFAAGLSMAINEILTRKTRVEAARAGQGSVVLEIAWREWQTAEAAKMALYSIVASQEAERLAAEASSRMDENVALVRRAVDAGILTRADVAAAESAAAEARADLLDARAGLELRRLDLNRLLGLPGSEFVPPQDGVELPDHVDTLAAADLEPYLEDRRLDLQALRQGYASQEASLHEAILGQFPRLVLAVSRARDTGNVTTRGFSVTLGLPLFDRNRGAIAAATASRQQLFDEYVSRVFDARADVASAVEEVHALDLRLEAERHAEASTLDLEATYREAMAQGQVTALDYVNAWRAYQAVRLRQIVLRGQLQEARVKLELASGLYRVDVQRRES
jgi:outer membrane protein TolC